jgi:hypothetical protein
VVTDQQALADNLEALAAQVAVLGAVEALGLLLAALQAKLLIVQHYLALETQAPATPTLPPILDQAAAEPAHKTMRKLVETEITALAAWGDIAMYRAIQPCMPQVAAVAALVLRLRWVVSGVANLVHMVDNYLLVV